VRIGAPLDAGAALAAAGGDARQACAFLTRRLAEAIGSLHVSADP
jgi:hypothetical protein